MEGNCDKFPLRLHCIAIFIFTELHILFRCTKLDLFDCKYTRLFSRPQMKIKIDVSSCNAANENMPPLLVCSIGKMLTISLIRPMKMTEEWFSSFKYVKFIILTTIFKRYALFYAKVIVFYWKIKITGAEQEKKELSSTL